jgi:hypothetical protein
MDGCIELLTHRAFRPLRRRGILTGMNTRSRSAAATLGNMRANGVRACASNGDVLPPLGLAATLPNRTNRCIHRTAELTLTSNRAPASTHSTNRVRRSNE